MSWAWQCCTMSWQMQDFSAINLPCSWTGHEAHHIDECLDRRSLSSLYKPGHCCNKQSNCQFFRIECPCNKTTIVLQCSFCIGLESSIISCCYGQDPSVGEVPECWVQIMCSTCMAVQGAGINTSLYGQWQMFTLFTLFKVVCSKIAIFSLFVWKWYKTPYSQFSNVTLWAFQQNKAKSRIKIYSVNKD